MKRGLWLTLLAMAVAAVWFFMTRTETPKTRTEKEAHRILSSVRRRDGSSFIIYSTLSAMQTWPRPFSSLAKMWIDQDSANAEPARSLAALGPLVVPILTNSLAGDRYPAVRAVAAEALGELRDGRLVPQLIVAFGSEPELHVQSSILDALGGIGDERAEPLLISVLHGTNDPQVRVSAARALGLFQSPRALTTLTNALATESNNLVRQWLVMNDPLWVTAPAAKPALLTALNSDSDASVRRHTARDLQHHPGDDTVAALITALREDADAREVRVAAVTALGEMTNVMVRSALLEAMRQDSPDVRAAAARMLGKLPSREAEAALLEVLVADSAPSVRAAGAEAIGGLAIAQTNRVWLPELIQSLHHDAAVEVRAAAAAALNRIGGAEVVNALRASLETERQGRVQVEAIGGLYQHSSSEVATLLLRLLDGNHLEPDATAEAVRSLGLLHAQPATSKLAQLVANSPEEEVRRAAATALGALDNSDAVVALKDALRRDDSAFVRTEIATALGGMQSARTAVAISALVIALEEDRENAVRAAVVSALGSLRDPTALPVLLKVLRRDADREARANAAAALGRLGRSEAIPPLEAALQRDRDRDVRVSAARSLAMLDGTEHTPLFLETFNSDPLLRPELANILGRIGSPDAVAVLLKSLKEGGWRERAAVILALGDAGDARATSALVKFLDNDPDLTTRAAAATALGRLCNPEAAPALEKAMQDRIGSVRQEAAWALGHIGEASAVPTLSNALSDRNPDVRFAAAFALAEIGARSAAPTLAPLLRHSDERTRLAAASALAFLDHSEGVEILSVNLHSGDVWRRFTALISLLRLDTPGTRRLLADRHDADPTLAAAIEGGLRLGGAGAATNMLCSARDSDSMTEDFRHFGARSLVIFNEPATLPALRANANDPREEVRSAVRVAIRRLEKRIADGKSPVSAR